jgi:hypothetical protein
LTPSLWPLLSALAGLIAVVAVGAERRSITAAPTHRVRALLPELRRAREPSARLELVRQRCPAASWEAHLASAVGLATSLADRVDAASEATWELSARFASRARWGSSGIRLAAAAGFLLAVTATALGEKAQAVWALVPALAGAVTAFAMHAGTRSLERTQRELADDLVRLLVPEAHERRSGRRRG